MTILAIASNCLNDYTFDYVDDKKMLESIALPLNGHFQNMLKLMLIAFACAFNDGLVRSASKGIPVMKSNSRRLSLFSFGLAKVLADLVDNPRYVKTSAEIHHRIVMYEII